MPVRAVQLYLSPGAEETWTQVVAPWLAEGRGRLGRAYVIVPTRGQTQALKQRCVAEGAALLGVEFLSPGLARKKWAALAVTGEAAARPAIGRELLLLGLRTLVAKRLAGLAPTAAAWGFWKSLQSDPERALDDFDDLLKAGFRARDFPLAPLAEIFGELENWVAERGYAFAPVQAEAAGLRAVADGETAIGGRLLVCGASAELWGEFFNMAAFVRRCADVTVVLPAPEFGGRAGPDEKWVELWSTLLGVAEPVTLERAAEDVAAEAGDVWSTMAEATVVVGRTRTEEMERVAELIAARLAAGAENIAVIFPRADAAQLELARRLAERGIQFVDLLGAAGTPPIDTRVQRALLDFHAKGGRLEELLALWPLLRATGAATVSVAEARRACERAFDETQTHQLAKNASAWRESIGTAALADVADKLLPVWPEELTLAEGVKNFRAACEAFEVEPPPLGALEVFAGRSPEKYPLTVVVEALASFLPETSPVAAAAGRGGFSRVTLTTRRRAEGVGWSHVIFTEGNAGVWPERRESSCWLPDEQREQLNARARFGLALFTAEQRAALERAGLAALARDARDEVVLSAALFDAQEPELKLSPNAWLERVLWAQGAGGADGDLEKAFERAAQASGPAADGAAAADEKELAAWHAVWSGRRDATRPFDEFFFAGDPALITPKSLSARRVEAGVRDPARLWFESVLGAERVEWGPLQRARRRALGQRAHEMLALALRPVKATAGRGFGEMPSLEEARARLEQALAALRTRWPEDAYWDSFRAELAHVSEVLLANVYEMKEAGRYVATEAWLPAGASVPLGGGMRFPVVGRMDLVLLDRAEWRGARVDVIDFKTGVKDKLSAAAMGRSGAGLQLGVYLAATLSLGAAGGRVWMVKPEEGGLSAMGAEELDVALALLARLERAVRTGVYGALTPDRSEYSFAGYDWPLACAPVAEVVLAAKFAATFGEDGAADAAGEGAGDV